MQSAAVLLTRCASERACELCWPGCMAASVSVRQTLLHLNDWLPALGFVIQPAASCNVPVTLCLRDKVDHVVYLNGHTEREVMDSDDVLNPALIPITDDPCTILELLGFDNAQHILADAGRVTTRMACSLMCGSKYFSPELARNTGEKFGRSPLYAYVQETYPGKCEQPADRRQVAQARAEIMAAVASACPRVPALQAAAREQAQVFGAVLDRTWGQALPELLADIASAGVPAGSNEHAEMVRRVYARWCTFVKLHGLLPLHAMPADAAHSRWREFMRAPLAHPYDWQCVRL